MMTALNRISSRQDAAERIQREHEEEDKREFGEIRHVVAEMGKKTDRAIEDLGRKMDSAIGIIGQRVENMAEDKIKAEAFAAGVREASKPKEPNKWALALVPVVVAVALSVAMTWIGHDLWEGSPKRDQTTVTTTAVVEHPASSGH